MGAPAAKHQGHGGGLQPCKRHAGWESGLRGAPPAATPAQADSPRLWGRNSHSGLCGSELSTGRISQKPSCLILIHREAQVHQRRCLSWAPWPVLALEPGAQYSELLSLAPSELQFQDSVWLLPCSNPYLPHPELPHSLPSSQPQPPSCDLAEASGTLCPPEHPVPLGPGLTWVSLPGGIPVFGLSAPSPPSSLCPQSSPTPTLCPAPGGQPSRALPWPHALPYPQSNGLLFAHWPIRCPLSYRVPAFQPPPLCPQMVTQSFPWPQPHLCSQCRAAAPARIPGRGRCRCLGPPGCRAGWGRVAAGRTEP